jgi:hypothetical protein
MCKDRQLLQNQCNSLCNGLVRIIKKRMKNVNSVAHSDLPLALYMVDELEPDLDSAVANYEFLFKQLLQAQYLCSCWLKSIYQSICVRSVGKRRRLCNA